jgi:Transposase IS116/IS110/IS902 family
VDACIGDLHFYHPGCLSPGIDLLTVATTGPIPGILRMRVHPASLAEMRSSSSFSSSICCSTSFHSPHSVSIRLRISGVRSASAFSSMSAMAALSVAAIGNGAAFRKGREFAAWLGIVPRQYSTGGKAKLLGISKRGNVYLRKILIHGARAAVLRIKRDRAPIGAWLDALDARAPKNVVVVAMANKLARIAWAVLSSGNEYRPVAA